DRVLPQRGDPADGAAEDAAAEGGLRGHRLLRRLCAKTAKEPRTPRKKIYFVLASLAPWRSWRENSVSLASARSYGGGESAWLSSSLSLRPASSHASTYLVGLRGSVWRGKKNLP